MSSLRRDSNWSIEAAPWLGTLSRSLSQWLRASSCQNQFENPSFPLWFRKSPLARANRWKFWINFRILNFTFQTCIVIWCLGIVAALPNYRRSEHHMSNGKAECGINWSDDEDDNAKKILEDCKGTEVKDPTEFIEGRDNVKFFYLNNGWKCRCGVPTQEREMVEKIF